MITKIIFVIILRHKYVYILWFGFRYHDYSSQISLIELLHCWRYVLKKAFNHCIVLTFAVGSAQTTYKYQCNKESITKTDSFTRSRI